MINWRSTTTHHAVRRSLGLSNDEYCLLDWMYHTQGNEKYGHNGWCEVPYQDIADLLGISKGGAFKMVDRMEGKGLIEVNTANTKQKRVTSKFSLPVYFDVKEDEEVGAVIVQKVNAGNESVHLVNGERSLSERNRSLSERQIKINKEKEKDNTPPKGEKPVFVIGDTTQEVMDKVVETLRQYFAQNPERRTEIPMSAMNKANREQFGLELMDWIRYNANNRIIMQNPVKHLTSGPGNFTSWLAKDWCRKKYEPKAAKPAYQPKPEIQVPEYRKHVRQERKPLEL